MNKLPGTTNLYKPCTETDLLSVLTAMYVCKSTFFIKVCCHIMQSSQSSLVGSATCTLRDTCKA